MPWDALLLLMFLHLTNKVIALHHSAAIAVRFCSGVDGAARPHSRKVVGNTAVNEPYVYIFAGKLWVQIPDLL